MTRKDYVADNSLCKGLVTSERPSSSIKIPYLNKIWDQHDAPESEGVVRVNAGLLENGGGVGLSVAMESKEDDFEAGATAQLTEAQTLELIRYLIITTQFSKEDYIQTVSDAVKHRNEQMEVQDE